MIPPPGGAPAGHVAIAPVYVAPLHSLCCHEDGRPVAMIPATGKKEDSEVSEARALLESPQVCLENALLTADPLHNKEATLRVIVEKGGDYLVGTKGNTAVRFEAVEKALEGTPF